MSTMERAFEEWLRRRGERQRGDVGVAVGLVAFPAVLLAGQWLRARTQVQFQATGPVSTALNMLVFLALFLTPWYARPLAFTSDAALVFYGASMLLAALRGYGGCEVLAISPSAEIPSAVGKRLQVKWIRVAAALASALRAADAR